MGVGKEAIIRLAQLNCKCNCQLELSLAIIIKCQTSVLPVVVNARDNEEKAWTFCSPRSESAKPEDDCSLVFLDNLGK